MKIKSIATIKSNNKKSQFHEESTKIYVVA